jgi:hydrogenase maturation protease
MRDFSEQLVECCRGRVCLMGIGNVDWGDDGFGVHLVRELQPTLPAGHRVIVADAAPERFVGQVRDGQFDSVLFLDAVDFGGGAGSVILLHSDEIIARFPQISTHRISLGALAQCVEASGRTRVWLLGAQPASLAPGAELTPVLGRTVHLLAGFLRAALAARSVLSQVA